MTTDVNSDDIQITGGERLLAVVLAVFLLVGSLWAYAELDRGSREIAYRDPVTQLSDPQQAVLAARDRAVDRSVEADDVAVERGETLVDRREEYRTALDAGRRDERLRRRYAAAQAAYVVARRSARAREEQERAAQADARPVEVRLAALERAREKRATDQRRHDDLVTAGLRLVLVLAGLGAALWLLVTLRRRRSRWIVAAYAGVGAAAVLALVMGIDYLTDLFDPAELGPLVLSVIGTLFTLAAIAALQRYLARRLPGRRVRHGDCPFCGYPVRGKHCEGCGRQVTASCARCAAPRRVGTAHCPACGEA